MIGLERLSQIALILIATVIGVTALKQVENIFAPMALALVAGVVLSPLVAFWDRTGLPKVFGALLTLGLTLSILATVAVLFQPLIVQLIHQAPKVWADMQSAVRSLRAVLQSLAKISQSVSDAMAPASGTDAAAADATGMTLPTVTDALMLAPAFLEQLLVFSGTLFFFVLTRHEIYTWAAISLSGPTERAQTSRRLMAAEEKVSRYFFAIALVNAGLGVTLTIFLAILGLPDAVLWGVMAFLLNFVVYLGPATLTLGLLFAGVAAFDGALTLAPMLGFMAMTAVEGQFLTPAIIGRRLALNPLLVFLALIFGIWLWGPLGGVVAIPLLVWVLVLNDALRDPGA